MKKPVEAWLCEAISVKIQFLAYLIDRLILVLAWCLIDVISLEQAMLKVRGRMQIESTMQMHKTQKNLDLDHLAPKRRKIGALLRTSKKERLYPVFKLRMDLQHPLTQDLRNADWDRSPCYHGKSYSFTHVPCNDVFSFLSDCCTSFAASCLHYQCVSMGWIYHLDRLRSKESLGQKLLNGM